MHWRVLVVEDEMMIALLIEDMLLDSDYKVAGMAGNVPDALEAVACLELDGAILDVNLAGERVYPVADALIAKNLPFFFLTGYGAAGIAPAYRDRPVLDKPFSFSMFSRMLHSVFGLASA